MKYIFLFSIGAIISSCQSKKETVAETVHPRIKVLLESFHKPIGKLDAMEYRPEVSEDTFIYESRFNSKGQLVKKSRFDSDGNLKSATTLKYDSRGNNIREDELNANGILLKSITSRFDASGYLIERNEVDANDQILNKQRFEHTNDGYRWVVAYTKIKGRLTKSHESVFDKKGLNISNNYYTNEMTKKKQINTYNPNGDPIQLVNLPWAATMQVVESDPAVGSYLDDFNLKTKEEHEYDTEGNRIATIQYFPLTNKRITTRYKYTKNRIEMATLQSNKIVSSKKIVRYDDKQNVTEIFRYGLGGHLEEHQRHLYEFDEAGNWTRHKTILNNKAVSMVIRQIEYF